jgi:hypothetical protein
LLIYHDYDKIHFIIILNLKSLKIQTKWIKMLKSAKSKEDTYETKEKQDYI